MAKRKKKAVPAYEVSPTRAATIAGAVKLAQTVLKLDLPKKQTTKILKTCQWFVTEADGKYTTRYRSAGALKVADKKKLNHEHVTPIKLITEDLLAAKGNNLKIEKIMSKLIGCTVTRKEHDKLTKADKTPAPLRGWDRYKVAGIVVYDLKHETPRREQQAG